MMHRSEEFLMSDDSDVPELDLPSTGRQEKLRLFRSSSLPQSSVAKARQCFTSKCFLMLMLMFVIAAIVFLGVSHLRLIKQLEGLLVLPQQLDSVERKLNYLKTDNGTLIDMNSEKYGEEFVALKKEMEELSSALEVLSSRLKDYEKNSIADSGKSVSAERNKAAVTLNSINSVKKGKRKRSKSSDVADKVVFERAYP
uniref:Uncharacterized protein n=1 Tax=Syphacia muris TaxID=451379 RepID=A0A0N5A8Q2_9BILA